MSLTAQPRTDTTFEAVLDPAIHSTPERRIAAAVIATAIKDIVRPEHRGCWREEQKDAERFMRDGRLERWCLVLGWDAGYIRRKLGEIVGGDT